MYSVINKEKGRLIINYYGPRDYKSEPQNLAILQDRRGIIYAGNNSGTILEFDGVSWRHITIPNKLPIESLAEDEQGRIYVGGTKDFGFLKPDSNGNLHFQSLLSFVDEKDRNFTWVTPVISTANGIYFQTRQSLFRWQNNRMKIWRANTSFTNSFWVYNNLYIQENQTGLMKLQGDSLVLVPGGEKFAKNEIQVMLPFKANKIVDIKSQCQINKQILIGIANRGLFIFNGESIRPFNGAANGFIKKNGIRCGSVINDSSFAVGSLQDGIIIFNTNGDITEIIDRNSGLPSNIVYSIIPDIQGGIWLALQKGVANLVSVQPAFTIYDRQNGLDGVVLALPAPVRYKGILYVITTTGVYYLEQKQNRFKIVSGLTGDFWNLFKYRNSLFAVREDLRKINGSGSSIIKKMDETVCCAQPSYIDSNRIYLGLKEGGFRILNREHNKWIESRKIKGIYEVPRNIVEEPNGDLWFGDESDGLIYIRFSDNKENPEIKRFGVKDGLPEGRIYAYRTSYHPVFSSSKGLFCFNSNTKKFIPDNTFGRQLSNGSLSTGFLSEDKKGNVWISVFDGTNYYLNVSRPQTDGTYSLERNTFLLMPSTGIWTIYPEDNGIIWFGGEEGLVRYNDNSIKYNPKDFQALVRKVLINGDSVIYGGYKSGNRKLKNIELAYSTHVIRFEYSSSNFDKPDENLYQVYLEGVDKGWSKNSSATEKEYTHLPAGDYVFHVRVKDIYGKESSEDTFSFSLLPPFYLSWWAFSIYGLIFISFLFLFINRYNYWHTNHLKQRTTELEKIVAHRTAELAEKNAELRELNKIKSRFFANISHEFRTPLTLIVGQIENLLPDLKKEHNIKRAGMALRCSRQLQKLINQLLDLSRFDANEMKLRVSEQNIVTLLRYLTGSFESLAEQKGITLKFESLMENIPVYFEQDKIEKIMHNLLSNALKFTPEGGKVTVFVNTELRVNKNNFSDTLGHESVGDAKIIVQDTGIGIPKDHLPHIFNRFFQVDNSTTREYEGTGIGLALVKELVQIHGGGISVESKEGSGTTFTILLPLGRAHLTPEQIEGPLKEVLDLSIIEFADTHDITANQEIINQVNETVNCTESKIVLIVEDNPDMRSYITETLVNDYNIIEASNGAEGLEKAVEEIPDLIITDVMMPVIDGFELTRNLRKNQVTSHIPIIMLTAKAEENDKFEGLETGVNAFLLKPFSTKELKIRVRKLIELRERMIKQIGAKVILTPAELSVSSIDQQFLEKMHNIIEKNMGNEKFGVDILVEQLGISKRQLQRKLKALIDSTPTKCIRVMRLNRAKQLLEQNAGNVTEVAFSVGYTDLTAFSRAFKEEFNVLPSSMIPVRS